jgi:hypothetical protein
LSNLNILKEEEDSDIDTLISDSQNVLMNLRLDDRSGNNLGCMSSKNLINNPSNKHSKTGIPISPSNPTMDYYNFYNNKNDPSNCIPDYLRTNQPTGNYNYVLNNFNNSQFVQINSPVNEEPKGIQMNYGVSQNSQNPNFNNNYHFNEFENLQNFADHNNYNKNYFNNKPGHDCNINVNSNLNSMNSINYMDINHLKENHVSKGNLKGNLNNFNNNFNFNTSNNVMNFNQNYDGQKYNSRQFERMTNHNNNFYNGHSDQFPHPGHPQARNFNNFGNQGGCNNPTMVNLKSNNFTSMKNNFRGPKVFEDYPGSHLMAGANFEDNNFSHFQNFQPFINNLQIDQGPQFGNNVNFNSGRQNFMPNQQHHKNFNHINPQGINGILNKNFSYQNLNKKNHFSQQNNFNKKNSNFTNSTLNSSHHLSLNNSTNSGNSFTHSMIPSNSKKLETPNLEEIIENSAELCKDHSGSRLLQKKYEEASESDRERILHKLLPNFSTISKDVFGNYMVQKIIELSNDEQLNYIIEKLSGKIHELTLHMYGCRVIQKMILISTEEILKLILDELKYSIVTCIEDQNGNHVIQKLVEKLPSEYKSEIIIHVYGKVYCLSVHQYGCRVVQRIFEYCNEEERDVLFKEINPNVINLCQDQFGNYVIQHILERSGGLDHRVEKIFEALSGKFFDMSVHKFARLV